MKLLISLIVLSFSYHSFANTITCADNNFSITIDVDTVFLEAQSKPASRYKVQSLRTGEVVKAGYYTKVIEGAETSMLNLYVWAFTDREEKDIIGIATDEFLELKEGTWSGSADLHIETSVGSFSGSTISCKIVIGNPT